MQKNASLTLEKVSETSDLRRTFGCFPSGVAAVCAIAPDAPVGLIVSSFTSVSIDPPLVSICIMRDSRRWKRLRVSDRLGVSFLGNGQEQVCRRFTGPPENGFEGLEIEQTNEGAVFLSDATALLDCSVYEEVDAGDHTIVLLKIEALQARPTRSPLVFHNSKFHELAPQVAS
ncbi:MAG: flavin reductase family protein [Pseudomonadota bacterium]